MFWEDIMTLFGPMCVVTSAIARFIPIFKLAYFWNAKTYTGEILTWRHIDGVLSEKPQNAHNLTSLFFNGCLGWKFKNCWNDCWLLFGQFRNLKKQCIWQATMIPGQSKFYGKNGVPPGQVFRDQNSGIFLSRRDIWHVCVSKNVCKTGILKTYEKRTFTRTCVKRSFREKLI